MLAERGRNDNHNIKSPADAANHRQGTGETPTTKSSISFAILAREMQKGKEKYGI